MLHLRLKQNRAFLSFLVKNDEVLWGLYLGIEHFSHVYKDQDGAGTVLQHHGRESVSGSMTNTSVQGINKECLFF